ncbi:hypothetical protein JG687_00002005 [Phytophthora cactorum]|uniref:Gamma tubulin complex component C-terminal domain-containing protein n=1 Tax=Phytophthora cactorum TaxID=29920 RepID=A0A8T1UVU2_9STRA|nr:hypothetical protein JG687_00002005 [Phytophthora cactorum]
MLPEESATSGSADDVGEESALLIFVMKKLFQLEPIEYVDQLIEKTDMEFQDYRKQYNLNFAGTLRRNNADAPSPQHAMLRSSSGRFASFSGAGTFSPSGSPRAPLSPMRHPTLFPASPRGRTSFNQLDCNFLKAGTGDFTFGAQLATLCAHISGGNQAHEEDQSSLSKETLLLRADRVVGQLYSHRFVDTLPQDVQAQTQALATKFRVHSLEDRADKLLQLVPHCDYQVLKLLLELATSPTTATDQEVVVDLDTKSRWKTVQQQEQLKLKQHKMMQDQLVEELFQISTNDEWYQAWEDSDDDESDWDMSSTDESAVESERSVDIRIRNAKRSCEELEDEGIAIQQEQGRGESSKQIARQEMERKRMELSDEALEQDEILCRYYSEVCEREMEVDDVDPTCELDKRPVVPFTLERPWLLCGAVVKSADNSVTTKDIVSIRLIHEETVVTMIFEALHGVDSLLFEFHPCRELNGEITDIFRDKLNYMEHVEALRMFVLMEQMDATHEQYLDHLLNRFFLLDKHATVIQYILTTFNHILRFVRQVNEFVSAVDRNMHYYFPDCCSEDELDQVASHCAGKVPSVRLLEHSDFRPLQSEMARSSKEFKRQSHFLVVMLTAMQKHGASPHVNEIVTQLNYNYFYHQQEHRSRTQPHVQQPRPVKVVKKVNQVQAPPLNRSGSLRPPPGPKTFSRTQSVQLS